MSAKEFEELRRQLEDEQRRRIAAEELAKSAQPQDLQQYLEACHSLDLGIQVVTDRSSTTKGDATNPTGRIFPRRIIPWLDFATKQEEVWERLSASPDFSSRAAFPSLHQLEYVESVLQPISSEVGLRNFERDVVENPVQKLIEEIYKDDILREKLGLEGTVTFESHTNLGPSSDTSSSISKSHRKKRRKGKGSQADNFCIYRPSEGRNVPVDAVEYKAPHKVDEDQIVAGLQSEIQPERDVINQDGQSFDFNSQALVAALVTQLYSYMVGKTLQYGYICTGTVLVFLLISDDPSVVHCATCIPRLDVMADDENRLHRTAVAQVFAFILQALSAEPPPESWHDAAAELSTWSVEYEDILSKIPASEKKRKEPRVSPYKPQRWKGFLRSPIRTRSRCQPLDALPAHTDNSDDDDPPSPTPNPSVKGDRPVHTAKVDPSRGSQRGNQQDQRQRQQSTTSIKQRPFCTQMCLLGLATGASLDAGCPNVQYHGKRHMNRDNFLHLLREQLAIDRDRDADCKCIFFGGAKGMLFKVRLSSHGYTLVAKGTESVHRALLKHENNVYDKLRPLQGHYVPVCLGRIDLKKPCHFDGGVYACFLFLSWAGQSLLKCINQTTKASLTASASVALKELHRQQVLHGDAEPRNMVYDPTSGCVMLIDFEKSDFPKSDFPNRPPLGQIGLNALNARKRRRIQYEREEDEFAIESQAAVDSIMSWRPCAARTSSLHKEGKQEAARY